MYAATSGDAKPAKHHLGLVLKSLTGSKLVIELLNRLGHCSSYNVIEGIETELTFSANAPRQLTPHGMKLSKDLGLGVAFDNFDRFVETSSGMNNLHDTVGITYRITNCQLNERKYFRTHCG